MEINWNAAGKEITWDMIHYDVQLIGGMVLHRKNCRDANG
jgi:preprotein translocase subunit SecA